MTSVNQASADREGSLRVLSLEDRKADVDPSMRALVPAGVKVNAGIPVTQEQLLAYARSATDVILSDHKTTSTTGTEAFERLKTERPSCLSGTTGLASK